MSFDLAATLRRLKPQKREEKLIRRPDAELDFARDAPLAGPPLLLDTCVYIDTLQGRAPREVKQLIVARVVNHSSVALAELVHLFGRLDPSDHRTRTSLAKVASVVEAMPPHRLLAPSIQAMAEAGMVSGTIARLRGLAKSDRQPLLNDAILFLQALEAGYNVLTRNIGDFDLIQQLVPGGSLLLYRPAE
ncbi:type II toxin-antitoxin system VapC family toxin [Sphingosinicella rhizophila]|uniref:PIN domain-containing protein n=1 Tax=Sphingosinicella rhizophila TaxID=3050082 RepID=A0ABU3QAV1_9SPHN|nr:hypothetical protein [Sphingosinicella sp. GR2756]MDT9600133.1 hypothetical protein [Sphingosinicella sp. GR2756]